jgi:UDP-N-acetylmuramoyl-tripeptide--D-alanyl-D-alanine ligase
MKRISITEAARWMGARVCGDAAGEFSSVSTDSRTVDNGACFFAIKGDNFDGHDYVAAALAEGAACAVVNDSWQGEAQGCLLRVRDTIEALGAAAGQYRRTLPVRVVGITGSAGKTTTREMIYHVLATKLKVHRSPKSFNNNIGVPMTIFSARGNEDALIVEMGTNHPGEIAPLTRIARPDIALITNVYPAHLEGFGSLDAIVAEKCSIAEGLAPAGKLIINGDIPAIAARCKAKGYSFTTFGRQGGCTICATGAETDGRTGSFTLDGVKVELPVPGLGNIENAIAAWAVAREFGFSMSEFALAMRTLKPAAMRMEVLELGRATVLCDCYNANPGSMQNALGVLAGLARSGRRTLFICGPMKELGDMSDQLHADLGRRIADAGVDLLLAAGPMDPAIDAARKAAKKKLDTVAFADTVALCKNLRDFVRPDDIILVKGSRAVRLELAIEELRRIFA